MARPQRDSDSEYNDRRRDRYASDPEYREAQLKRVRATHARLHAELAASDRHYLHGTTTGYFSAKCKCRRCKDAMNVYFRVKRRRKGMIRRYRSFNERGMVHQQRLGITRAMCRQGQTIDQVGATVGVNHDTALRCARVLGLTAQFWENRIAQRRGEVRR